MKITIASVVSKSSHPLQRAVVLCLLFALIATACGTPPATEAPTVPAAPTTPVPTLAIVTGGPCEVALGKTIPLSAEGMPGTDVAYSWTASAGNVSPPNNSVVTYTAPNEPGDVIIKVVAEKNGVASEGTIKCQVTGPTPTPENTPTLAPTLTPIPSPTSWTCTSFRSAKIQDMDVAGVVTIGTPVQAAMDIPSGTRVQVSGSYSGIPEGQYLWVFIYSQKAGAHGRYYPQTTDATQNWQPEPTTGPDGRWGLDVNFGAANECYEVIVMLANAEASQAIADQLKRWADANHYTGYELNGPSTAEPPDAPGFPAGLVEKASIEVKTR